MPTPLVVVDDSARIVYANQAMYELGGWSALPASDKTILHFVHPADADELTQAFSDIVASPQARVLGSGSPWAEIFLRITGADGTSIPIELTGRGGVLDEAVGGVIYEVRPARSQQLLGRVLEGLSQGASLHYLLTLVVQMMATPPLDLDAAILQSTSDGQFIVAASTSMVLSEALKSGRSNPPWRTPAAEPTFDSVDALPERIARHLAGSDYRDLWHVGVESPLTEDTLRIIAVSRTHHVSSTGPLNRMLRAQELAGAVLLRTQSDVLLAYAADHDRLTSLPNRAAFYQLAEAADPHCYRAAIRLDLDGLKAVNKRLGPPTGDAVLQIIADRLRSVGNDQDAIIGRIGGHEFALLMSDTGDELRTNQLADSVAAQVLEAVQEPIVVAGRSLSLSANVGLATAAGGISTDQLLTWADAAMQDAEQAGGGQIRRYGIAFG